MTTAAKFLRSALLSLLLLPAFASAKALADYQIGETAAADITTPVALTVVDHDDTEMLRGQEAARVPVIFRFNPQAAAEAETAFRDAFAATREKFLTRLEKRFRSRKLDETFITNGQFQKFLAAFSPGGNAFPADKTLLTRWAKGESDDAMLTAFAAKLRDVANRYIRAENLPRDLMPGVRVQLIAVTNAAAAPTLEMVRHGGVEMLRMRLHTLGKARGDLLDAFTPPERPAARFLAGLLKENCTPDAELTRQSRAKQIAAILSADHYDAGQIIVRRGQTITTKHRAALAELAKELAAAQNNRTPIPWAWIALIVALPCAGFVVWQITRRQQQRSMLPVKFAGGAEQSMVIACPTCAGHIVVPAGAADGELPSCGHDHTPEHWQKRALVAEARAEQATAMVRAGLLPQIARFLTDGLVKKLVFQRAELLATQNQAAGAVDDLAGRLENLETAPDSWREFYEGRIAELEKELETKSEENRELIRTQIAIARRQMAEAQVKARWTN